jgi:hypothetical protein
LCITRRVKLIKELDIMNTRVRLAIVTKSIEFEHEQNIKNIRLAKSCETRETNVIR